jgi:queuine tRNA-ribosyltransferase
MPPFEIHARDPGSRGRAGVLHTAHGDIRTPGFVPLATKATVRGLTPA